MGKLNELQIVELEILAAFAKVAERESLSWFIMFGTLLGAVREKGFIPWDDDIDIALPRADYDRLRLSEGWFSEPYFLQTPHNDPAGAPHYVRLRRSDTTFLKHFPSNMTKGGHMGAYIDILPLDEVRSGQQARGLQEALGGMQRQMLATAALEECDLAHMYEGKLRFCYGAGGVPGLYSLIADRYEQMCPIDNTTMPYYAMPVLHGERGQRVYEKDWFTTKTLMTFEGLNVPAPAGWKETLIVSYPDGLYEPEEKERTAEHRERVIVDMRRPYTDYTRRYTDMLRGIEGKDVYLFGAGDSLRIWLARYSEGLHVAGAFDNAPSKWGKNAYGVPVYPPAELKERYGDDARIIIASIYREEIALQLEEMGVLDYYVFVDGWGYMKGAANC